MVHVVLADSGNLRAAYTISSAGSILDEAAVSAIKEACPYRHGLDQDLRMDIPIRFYQS